MRSALCIIDGDRRSWHTSTSHGAQTRTLLGIDQPIVSQQLARLRASGVVTTAKSGTTVTYALADPLLKELLRVAKDILNRRLTGAQVLLRELRRHHA